MLYSVQKVLVVAFDVDRRVETAPKRGQPSNCFNAH